MAKRNVAKSEGGAFEVTGTLPSGDRWTFLTESAERADESCRQKREYLQNVVLNDLLRFAPALNEHPYLTSGKDEQGDLWIFSSQDRERAKEALADFVGYRDVKFAERGVGYGKA